MKLVTHRLSSSERPIRMTIIAPSIVADVGNPMATTLRSIYRALFQLGHDVTVWEQRRNAPTLQAMSLFGAAPIRAFQQHYPEVRYRTYELPEERQLTTWLNFELAISDAVLAFQGIPEPLWRALPQADLGPAVKMLEVPETLHRQRVELLVTSSQGEDSTVNFGPAVLRTTQQDVPRHGTWVVAYDECDLTTAEIAALRHAQTRFVSAGLWQSVGWEAMNEVDLEQVYLSAEGVLVVGQGDTAAAAARMLLPGAGGCPALDRDGAVSGRLCEIAPENDAEAIALNLVQVIRHHQVRSAPGLN